jgi:teichuronic acid biosynthesis glycosyltransferase TuaG
MPYENADVSVIMPALNAAATIKLALESVAAQSLAPREVVVIDDGSNDGTYKTALSCAALLGAIELHVYQQDNRGAGAARNRAIQTAAGRYIAFLDADDEWLPTKLERSLPYFSNPDVVLVSHNNLHLEAGTETVNDSARRYRQAKVPFVGLYRKGFIGTCTVVARRDAVLGAGGFDPDLRSAQDFDLWLAMLAPPATRFVVFDEALSRYHVTKGNITSHTGRRLLCGQVIAERHANALKNYPGSMTLSLAFRIVAIFNEARVAYLAKGDIWRAVWVAGCMPFAVVTSLIKIAAGSIERRKNYLQAAGGGSDGSAGR